MTTVPHTHRTHASDTAVPLHEQFPHLAGELAALETTRRTTGTRGRHRVAGAPTPARITAALAAGAAATTLMAAPAVAQPAPAHAAPTHAAPTHAAPTHAAPTHAEETLSALSSLSSTQTSSALLRAVTENDTAASIADKYLTPGADGAAPTVNGQALSSDADAVAQAFARFTQTRAQLGASLPAVHPVGDMAATADPATHADWTATNEVTGQVTDLGNIVAEMQGAGVDADTFFAEVAAVLEYHDAPLSVDPVIPEIIPEPAVAGMTPQDTPPAPAPAPAPSSSSDTTPAADSSSGSAVIAAAQTRIGSPYGWGATGPGTFDCSGLVQWAHAQAGISVPRTSQAQIAAGTPVSRADMRPGDVIGYYGGNSHVALYVGDGMMIDSLNSGSTVQLRPVDYMPVNSIVRFH